MNKSQRQIVSEKARDYAENNLNKINVVAGDYDGSQKCQHRARQLLETNPEATVVITLSFVPNSGVNLHVINKVGDEYIDNTLGYLSKRNTYFLVSEHGLDDVADMNMSKLLLSQKEAMLNSLFTPDELQNQGITTDHL